jgi:hypothetical protein
MSVMKSVISLSMCGSGGPMGTGARAEALDPHVHEFERVAHGDFSERRNMADRRED